MRRTRPHAVIARLTWLVIAAPAYLVAFALFFPEIIARSLIDSIIWPFVYVATGRDCLFSLAPEATIWLVNRAENLKKRLEI